MVCIFLELRPLHLYLPESVAYILIYTEIIDNSVFFTHPLSARNFFSNFSSYKH